MHGFEIPGTPMITCVRCNQLVGRNARAYHEKICGQEGTTRNDESRTNGKKRNGPVAYLWYKPKS